MLRSQLFACGCSKHGLPRVGEGVELVTSGCGGVGGVGSPGCGGGGALIRVKYQ